VEKTRDEAEKETDLTGNDWLKETSVRDTTKTDFFECCQGTRTWMPRQSKPGTRHQSLHKRTSCQRWKKKHWVLG